MIVGDDAHIVPPDTEKSERADVSIRPYEMAVKEIDIYESYWGAMGAPPVAGGATRASGRGRQMRKAFESRRRCRAPQQGDDYPRVDVGIDPYR